MKRLQYIVALFVLLVSGQALAWTDVINNTDYPIRFRAALRGGDINKNWQRSRVIPPHTGTRFTQDKGGDLNFLRFRYDIFADYGDGNFIQVFAQPAPNEAGNRRIEVHRSDNGSWFINSAVRGVN